MWSKGFKILTFAIILFFFLSCTKTVTYVAPQEKAKISTAKKIIIVLNNGTLMELIKAKINGEKLVGYTKDNVEKEIAFSEIQSIRIERTDISNAVLYSGVAIVEVCSQSALPQRHRPRPPSAAHLSIPSMARIIYSMRNRMEQPSVRVLRGLNGVDWNM